MQLFIIVQSAPARIQALQLHSRRPHHQLQGQILGSSLRAGCPSLGIPEPQQPCLRLPQHLLARAKQALSIRMEAALSRDPLQAQQVHLCMYLWRS